MSFILRNFYDQSRHFLNQQSQENGNRYGANSYQNLWYLAVECLHYSILMSYSIAHIGMIGELASILRHLLLHVIYDMFLFPLGSIYTTLAISTERYITVCHPFFKISHTWSARRYLVPILILSISYNIPKFFELEVKEETGILKSLFSLNYFIFFISVMSQHIQILRPTEMRCF